MPDSQAEYKIPAGRMIWGSSGYVNPYSMGCRRPQTAMKVVKTYLKHNPFFLDVWFLHMSIGIALYIVLQCGKY